MSRPTIRTAALIAGFFLSAFGPGVGHALSGSCGSEWESTDFSKHSVDLDEIMSGGVCKDQIPSIDDPIFIPVAEATDIGPQEPVISLTVNGEARAYPLRILTWHEIVIGGGRHLGPPRRAARPGARGVGSARPGHGALLSPQGAGSTRRP